MSTCTGCCQCLRERTVHCMKYKTIWTLEYGRAERKDVPCTICFKIFQARSQIPEASEENFYYKAKTYEELEDARRNLETAKKHIVSQDIHYDSRAALCFRLISAAYDALKKIHDHYAKHLGADIE